MAATLRDETSGICFRELHGFCSTGSQISWLDTCGGASRTGGGGGHHFFTGASDPSLVAYKHFSFPESSPPENSMQATQYGTVGLWAAWRELALRGAAPTPELTETVFALYT